MRASGDPRFLDDGPWGQMVAMADATFRMLATGASWSGHERNHLFLGRPGEGEFTRVTGISGLDDQGDTMAAAMLDYDRDGWVDVALENISGPRFRLLRNETKGRVARGSNGFLAVRFVGGNDSPAPRPGWSARDALGARVEVELEGGRRLVRELRRYDGFKSQHSATLLVGIGPAERAASLRIAWPSGREGGIAGVASGTLVTFYEDPAHSPTGEAAVSEPYAQELSSDAAATTLRLEGLHGERGLTVYTTMSTTCAACKTAQPDLRRLREAFDEGELTLVGVPVSDADTAEKLREYVEKNRPPYTLPAELAPEARARVREAVASALKGEGAATPASIVTDAGGRILAARWGVPTLSELRRLEAELGSDDR